MLSGKDNHQHVIEPLPQASLADDAKNSQKASLLISTDGQEIVLCNLRERTCENVALDLILDQELSFTVKGHVAVHLSGYYMPVMDEESEDEYSDGAAEFSSDEDGLHLIHGHDSGKIRVVLPTKSMRGKVGIVISLLVLDMHQMI